MRDLLALPVAYRSTSEPLAAASERGHGSPTVAMLNALFDYPVGVLYAAGVGAANLLDRWTDRLSLELLVAKWISNLSWGRIILGRHLEEQATNWNYRSGRYGCSNSIAVPTED